MNLKLKEVITETSDTKTLIFEKPKELEFKPGQFFSFRMECDGQFYNRSYSTSASPTDQDLTFTIKAIPNGKMSPLLCNLKPGAIIPIKGPLGHFVFDDSEKRDVVFLCGGSGITPFRSMWRYILNKNLPNNIYLLYSVRTPDQIIFSKEINELEPNPIFRPYITCTRLEEKGNWTGGMGRIDIPKIELFIGDVSNKVFYLCGGKELTDSFTRMLEELDVAKEDIKTERFY